MKLVIKHRLRRIKATDLVYETLKRQILKWELLPGERIEEKQLARQLRVSRYLVRKAVLRLCEEGLLERGAQGRCFVAQLDLDKDDDLRFMRASMESALLRESVEEGRFFPAHIKMLEDCIRQQRDGVAHQDFHKFCEYDEKFHLLLIDINGRKHPKEGIQYAMQYLARIRYLAIEEDEHPQEIVQEHERMMDAIVRGDAMAAEQEMKDHIYKGYHTFLTSQGFQRLKPYL